MPQFELNNYWGGLSLLNHLSKGIYFFVGAVPIALIMMLVVIGVKIIFGKKATITFFNTLNEALWLITVVTILLITGMFEAVFSGTFGVTSIFDGSSVIDFTILSEGITPATILNMVLFLPFGFFSVMVFKKIRTKWIYGVLIGFLFTSMIESIQLFTGRFFQIDDILMNTLGTYIGYVLGIYLLKNKSLILGSVLNKC